VVQIGETVGHPRAQMEQSQRRRAAGPGVTVRGSGADSLEESENRPYAGYLIEAPHECELGSPRIGKADAGAQCMSRLEQRVGARPWRCHGISFAIASSPALNFAMISSR